MIMSARVLLTPARRLLYLLMALSTSFIITADCRYGSYLCTDTRSGVIRAQGVFYDYFSATFVSPKDVDHFNGFYFDNMTCHYTFKVPAGMHVYTEFVLMQLARQDCDGDYVTLLLPKRARRKICGEPHGNVYDIFEGNEARITFVSDDESRNLGFAGFFIAYDPELDVRPERRSPVELLLSKRTSSKLPNVEAEERNRDVENAARSNAWLFNNLQADDAANELNKNHDEKRSTESAPSKNLPSGSMSKKKERERLLKAAAVKDSFRPETLQFMRTSALHGGDLTQVCGANYAKTQADLKKMCFENNGLL